MSSKDTQSNGGGMKRRDLLLSGSSLLAASALAAAPTNTAQAQQQQPTPAPAPAPGRRPNILFIMGDDIGWFNVSAYNMGIMGYRTPTSTGSARKGRSSPTGTASRAAPPAAPPS